MYPRVARHCEHGGRSVGFRKDAGADLSRIPLSGAGRHSPGAGLRRLACRRKRGSVEQGLSLPAGITRRSPMRLLLAAIGLTFGALAPPLAAQEAKKLTDAGKTFQVPFRLTDTKHVLVRAKINGK